MSLKTDFPILERDLAFIPYRVLGKYKELTGSIESDRGIIDKLNAAYASCDESDLVLKLNNQVVTDATSADKLYYTSEIVTKDGGDTLVFYFRRNNAQGKQPWVLENIKAKIEYDDAFYVDLGDSPGNFLYRFAYWPNMHDDLKRLSKDLCLKENWSFSEVPPDDEFPILTQYIKYTFAKLWLEKKIGIGIHGNYAAFNTGLFNRNYKFIYVIFEKNIAETYVTKWKFFDFAIHGVGASGRLLGDNFSTLPQCATYYTNISDISYIFDYNKEPEEQLPALQFDHYFIDHPDRLPISFLLDGARKNDILLGKIRKDLSSKTPEQIKEHWIEVGKDIQNDADVYGDLEAGFREAVRRAVIRANRNYRTIVPIYFPAQNKTSLLLPLALGTYDTVDAAIVIERNRASGKYIAPTVLDLPKAYSNARLICKPESDWLNQSNFRTTVIIDEDDDE